MKSIVIAIISTLSLNCLAQECFSRGQEAQAAVLVKEARISEWGMGVPECLVTLQINWSKGENAYKLNPHCALSVDELEQTDLSGPLTENDKCEWSTGQELSGIFVRSGNDIRIGN